MDKNLRSKIISISKTWDSWYLCVYWGMGYSGFKPAKLICPKIFRGVPAHPKLEELEVEFHKTNHEIPKQINIIA